MCDHSLTPSHQRPTNPAALYPIVSNCSVLCSGLDCSDALLGQALTACRILNLQIKECKHNSPSWPTPSCLLHCSAGLPQAACYCSATPLSWPTPSWCAVYCAVLFSAADRHADGSRAFLEGELNTWPLLSAQGPFPHMLDPSITWRAPRCLVCRGVGSPPDKDKWSGLLEALR